MRSSAEGEITRLLDAWHDGSDEALQGLTTMVYGRLRELASQKLHRERQNHTLSATEVVHEAFFRLLDQRVRWRNRAHFLGVAGQTMRRVLLDHARRRQAAKRPGSGPRVTLSGLPVVDAGVDVGVFDLERALTELEDLDPRAVRVVELLCFAGCTYPEIAEALAVSEATVTRDWRMARAWLRRRLEEHGGSAEAREGP